MAAEKVTLAAEYFDKAVKSQVDGKIDAAIKHYINSLKIFPTAQTHLYLGVAYSLQGNYEKAIKECRIALTIDPECGVAYNNVGSYLLSLGKDEEAILWFEKAIACEEFEMKYEAFYNLGRIYEKKWELNSAIRCYSRALTYYPDYDEAQDSMLRLAALMN